MLQWSRARWILDGRELRTRLFLLIAALLSVATACAADRGDAAELDRSFRRSALQIATPDARLHRFDVWIADEEALRSRGLMYVKHLDQSAGMLFIYPQPQRISMWMQNTYVSLDMLFVAADGRVLRVVENTKPLSPEIIESGGEALGVVELPAGTAARLKIRAGARVMHPAFASR